MTSIILALLAANSWAWDADPGRVEERIGEIHEARKGLEGDALVADTFERASQAERPDWVDKSFWSEEFGGKTYYFGVGLSNAAKKRRAGCSASRSVWPGRPRARALAS